MPVGVVIGLCSALLTAVVTEIYCHRGLAHRAVRINKHLASVLDTYFRVVVMTDPETWAAVHRLHHRYADTPLDPHSPRLRRPLAVLAGSSVLFTHAKGRVPPSTPSTWKIPALRLLVVAVFWILFGPLQVLIMLVVHLVVYLGVMGAVNMVGHLYGRQCRAGHPRLRQALRPVLLPRIGTPRRIRPKSWVPHERDDRLARSLTARSGHCDLDNRPTTSWSQETDQLPDRALPQRGFSRPAGDTPCPGSSPFAAVAGPELPAAASHVRGYALKALNRIRPWPSLRSGDSY